MFFWFVIVLFIIKINFFMEMKFLQDSWIEIQFPYSLTTEVKRLYINPALQV